MLGHFKFQQGQGNRVASRGAKSVNRLVIVAPVALLLSVLGYNSGYADGWLPGTSDTADTSKAPNQILNNTLSTDGLRIGGIANSRHNLTMSYNNNASIMNAYRNNYYEICVYCHTPHGANSTMNGPLWNRTSKGDRQYTLYNQDTTTSSTTFFEPTQLDLNYSEPGPNSLTCLSCHDGATAIDSIINMPTQLNGAYRAGYDKRQEVDVNPDFLDQWAGNKLGVTSTANTDATGVSPGHMGFNSKYVAANGSEPVQGECITCHNPGSAPPFNAPDFQLFSIGDRYLDRNTTSNALPRRGGGYLADDHPIGVEYPKDFGPNVDYNEPNVKQPRIAFFDLNGNQHADPNEVRLYDSGDGYEVECASCHDPHGIKVTGDSNELIPSFLRVGEIRTDIAYENLPTGTNRSFVSGNAGSTLCLTCHVK